MADVTYKKLSPRDKILKRPGQVMGSIKTVKKIVYIAEKDGEEYKIIEKEIGFNNALLHCFMEVLSNAQNNYYESVDGETPSKMIKIEHDPETQSVCVWNDGNAIAIRKHVWADDEDETMKHQELYEHELIFGYLDSSSNFDDDIKQRKGGGLHGLGAKLVNIFSKEFKVEGHYDGQKIIVKWNDNMGVQTAPKITSLKSGKDYTHVSYILDLARFGEKEYSVDHLSVIKKMCIDCAVCTGLKVYFNGEALKPKNFMEYVSMYYFAGSQDRGKLEFKSNDSTLIVCEKTEYEPGLKQISFVNGILTSNGGVHIDKWLELILPPLLEKLKKKFKNIKLNVKNLYSYFVFFLKCDLINPNFDGNTKTILESPNPDTNLTNGKLETKIDKILKWEYINDIELSEYNKINKDAKKTDGTKSRNVYIENAVPCKFAGTAKSHLCTLIIVEGLSAKAMPVKAISTLPNKHFYGILPVRGKILNVRTAKDAQIIKNQEISNIKQMLGLKQNTKYNTPESMKSLRFGRVELWTDADPDGGHIKGLGINIFDEFWPELLDNGFVGTVLFPLAKAKEGKTIEYFYTMKATNDFSQEHPKASFEYYKGLGSYPDEDLANIITISKRLTFKPTKESKDMVDMIFNGKRSADKKVWLETPVKSEMETDGEYLTIKEFCDTDFKTYSFYSNERCIPSVVDGLKPAQRKAAWVGLHSLSRTVNYKVSQFANAVANKTQYHHDSGSLEETIIGMSQTFTGSNNVTIFEEIGQFGTRLNGGKDAASPRYISVRLSNVARSIFRKEDDAILEYLNDDGCSIEPKYFLPVVPLIGSNGSDGIGWAYSTHMLFYNPNDLVQQIKNRLNNISSPLLSPWYWNFKGTFVEEEGKMYCYGVYEKIDENSGRISELPVGLWTENYKAFLQKLKDDKLLTKWDGGDDPFEVDFVIHFDPAKFEANHDTLKLKKPLNINNMSAFTPDGTLKQYKNIKEIIDTFYKVRYEGYEKRKKYLLSTLLEEIKILENKLRYTNLIRSDSSILLQDENELYEYLKDEKFYLSEKEYKYLTNIRNGNFTNDNVKKLEKDIEQTKNEMDTLKKTSVKKMWLSDLDDFEKEFEKWKAHVLEIRSKLKYKPPKGKKSKN